jgi:hypothetical protein
MLKIDMLRRGGKRSIEVMLRFFRRAAATASYNYLSGGRIDNERN